MKLSIYGAVLLVGIVIGRLSVPRSIAKVKQMSFERSPEGLPLLEGLSRVAPKMAQREMAGRV
jgi:hypothetical protein